MKHFLNRHFREQWHQSKRQTRCLPNPEQPTLLHYESEVFQTIWILYSKRLYLNTSVDFRLLSLCKQWTIKQDCSSSHANTSLTNCVGQERFATGIGLETEITRIRQRAWFFTWRTMDISTVVSRVDSRLLLHIFICFVFCHIDPQSSNDYKVYDAKRMKDFYHNCDGWILLDRSTLSRYFPTVKQFATKWFGNDPPVFFSCFYFMMCIFL